MKKIFPKNLIFFLCLLVIISTTGCSGKNSISDMNAYKITSIEDTSANIEYNQSEYSNSGNSTTVINFNESGDDSQTALVGSGEASNAVNNIILSQRKIIRNANISLEVENFDVAYGKIEYIISNVGYVQESKISKVKHYVDNEIFLVTNGVIIIRVDADKFSSVLKDVKGLGLLTDENIKTEDVTEKFFDVESRLRLLRYEESRLEEYLKKIEDPDTIFKTERKLTDIRHEIEQLTGNLNKLSDLVKLSTITINMSEKVPTSKSEPPKQTYASKLKFNFLESLSEVIEFLGNILLGIAAALPVLVLLGIVFFVLYFLYKKFVKNKIKNLMKEPKDIEIDNDYDESDDDKTENN